MGVGQAYLLHRVDHHERPDASHRKTADGCDGGEDPDLSGHLPEALEGLAEGLLLFYGSLSLVWCFEGLLDVFPSCKGGDGGDDDHRDEADPDSFDDPVIVHEYATEEAGDDHGHPCDAAVGGVS